MRSQTTSPSVYRVYGFSLSSHIPLACPSEPQAGCADMELVATSDQLRALPARPHLRRPQTDDWFHSASLDDGSTYLRWTRLFEFLISSDGRRIACRALEGASEEAFRTYLVTQAVSCALVKQGIEPLHATVAVVDGRAVAFLGNCGHGKSSLGAAFLRAGYPLLTDDLLVISGTGSSSDPLLAHPGPPRLKLFPAVATRLLKGPRTGIRMNPDTKKLILPLSKSEHCTTAVPLRALYVLQSPSLRRPSRITITTLPARRACLALIAGTFNLIVTDRTRLARQFEWAARLATAIPVKSLSYPRSLAQVSWVVAAVQSDVSR